MSQKSKKAEIHLRIDYKQKEEYKKRADELRLPLTEYIIKCVNQNRIIHLIGIRDVLNQLIRIGANINQITGKANTIDYISQNDINELQDLMEKTFRVVEKFVEDNRKNINKEKSTNEILLFKILDRIDALEEKLDV